MKKIIYPSILVLIILIWFYLLNFSQDKIEMYSKNIETGDTFFNKQLYNDSLEYYTSASKVISSDYASQMIIESNIGLENYNLAYDLINRSKLNYEIKNKLQSIILTTFYQREDYSNLNKFLDMSLIPIKKEYKSKLKGAYIIYDEEFQGIDFLPSDQDNYVVYQDNEARIINNNSKYTNSLSYQDIRGIDDEFINVYEENQSRIYDSKSNLRFKSDDKNIFSLNSNYMVKIKDDKYFYIDRSDTKTSKSYVKASNFRGDKAIVFDGSNKIIDNSFNIIEEIDGDGFKTDHRNNAIKDNKVILSIGNKMKMYNFETQDYSSEFEDIDFSYGNLIAVKLNNKWGYMDQDFNLVIDFAFDSAKSFTCDLGLVKIDGLSKLIDSSNKSIKIKDYIVESFNDQGISFIRVDDTYKMIKLVEYINE